MKGREGSIHAIRAGFSSCRRGDLDTERDEHVHQKPGEGDGVGNGADFVP